MGNSADTVELMLACNDDRNGNFQGYVEHIDLLTPAPVDILLSMVGDRLSCRWLENDRRVCSVKVGHITLDVTRYQAWVGYWCWDSVRVTPEDAARLINYLHRRKWQAEIMEVRLGDKLNAGQKITGADILASCELEECDGTR